MRLALVPLDGSDLSDSILSHVEHLLGKEPFDVLLLQVLPPSSGAAQPERDAAAAHLAAVRERIEARGARVTTELREGDPATEILAVVEERSPALVAMSSHGRTGVLRLLRGSVAEQVLRSCPAPLLLVTPHTDPTAGPRFRRILVPLDGGERSASILPLVKELARLHGAEVLLLRVEWEGVNRPVLATKLTPEHVAESLLPWISLLTAEGLAARALAAQGDSADEILDVSEREGVDLVAMATHGRSGLARLIDGSVAEQVLRRCKKPLLVARLP